MIRHAGQRGFLNWAVCDKATIADAVPMVAGAEVFRLGVGASASLFQCEVEGVAGESAADQNMQ